MSGSQNSFIKRQKEKQRLKKRELKQEKKEERKANNAKGEGLESMMAYLDKDGNITTTPPEEETWQKRNLGPEDLDV